MSKYVIDETTLVAMANEVRTLAGTANKLTTDEMATHTRTANEEVDTQEELIRQITTALRGKVASNTSGEAIIEPLEVTEE